MSVIAVKRTNGIIEIAGDTQSTWGSYKFQKEDPTDKQVKASGKIFQVNGMTVGCAGSLNHIGLLRLYCKTNRPKESEQDDVLEWFIAFKEWALKKAQVAFNDVSIHGLLILDGKVYSFFDFIEVHEIKDFAAVGSGMWLSLGAMEVGATAEEAVKIAIKYNLYCGGEVTKIIV